MYDLFKPIVILCHHAMLALKPHLREQAWADGVGIETGDPGKNPKPKPKPKPKKDKTWKELGTEAPLYVIKPNPPWGSSYNLNI